MVLRKKGLILAATAAVATALTLGGCGGTSDNNSTSGTGDGNTAAASDTEFQIGYNADGDHKAWVDAVTNSIANTLGIKASGNPYATFDEFRSEITQRQIKTAFRSGWQADYPGLNNVLGPLYYTNADSNDGDYSSADFDNLLNEANSAASIDESNTLLQQAQEIIIQDLPAIPLWYQNSLGGYAETVDNVVFNWKSVPVFEEITKADGTPVQAWGGEPQNPLIPTMTNEVNGGNILDVLFSGLVYYDADGVPHNELAESIETEDSQLFTIKIKPGQVFSDGQAINADAFVDAWDYGAIVSNEQLSSYFFEQIEGFSYEEDAHIKGAGLNVVDDLTFTVKLKAPAADFPLRLGYSAFVPLPASAFADMKAFGENPIGNGPYKMAGEGAWEHDVKATLVPNENYKGDRTPKNTGLTFIFYTDASGAYADLLAENLDVMHIMPASAFNTWEEELGDRRVNQPGAVFQSFTIPQAMEHFGGEEGKLRRAAISMAIDRDTITDAIFKGTRSPAQDFTSPVIDGWNGNLPGNEVLKYDPEKAKELWAQANEINPW
ncbi:MAG: ABC transporter substrate-binding protein [Bifidobacteriaceae bacterium]|jgi:oligopeptide transport system substrate-binding protein|nr:ABC transporter substrate-binding protein [Bifidobacteriaceae bacterium]